MEESKKQFLEWTKQIWEPYSRKALSEEDAREIMENMTGFFKVLKEWEEKDNDGASSSSE